MRYLSALAHMPLDIAGVAAGALRYRRDRTTPAAAYQRLIRLFCVTGGLSNDVLSWLIRCATPKISMPRPVGVLGDMHETAVNDVVRDLKNLGYHVFEQQLPAQMCDRLLEFALTREALVRTSESTATIPSRAVYRRGSPQGVRYDFEPQDVINHPDVQALLADSSIVAVAQAYLGCAPRADVTGMWWHTDYSDVPDEQAAQFFHFDMDRIKWLKFFIYLTDVSEDSGPHCFVAGSHRTGAIPWRLRSKGYSRLTDAEVQSCFAEGDFMQFTAKRGTVIAEDTRGLHKGKHVRSGDRLMLQLQFSNSYFGGTYPVARFQPPVHPALEQRLREAPAVYRAYLSHS